MMLHSFVLASPFSDIPSSHWAREAILSLSAQSLVTGYPGGEFRGDRSMTRYETAEMLIRVLTFLEMKRPFIPKDKLEELKLILANYQDEIEGLGVHLDSLEREVTKLETRVSETERIRTNAEFHTRFISTALYGNLPSGIGMDTGFADSHADRPYSLFPVKSGSAETNLGFLNLEGKVDENWEAGGRIAAFNSVGDSLNAITWGNTPPFFNNPFLGYPAFSSMKGELDQVFVKNETGTLQGTLGSFYPKHSPSYLYAGVPNLTEEGPDYLPNFGGDLVAQMKPYLFISNAYSEVFAGKLAQASAWPTEIFGSNAGIELLGFSANVHWMTAQNDPATMAPGASGLIPIPINSGAGWLNPLTLLPITVGPQKEKTWGADFSYTRSFHDHPMTFKFAYGNSNYKPNTNSTDNARGELYDISVEGELEKNLSLGAAYLSIDPKYTPMILPLSLPAGITLANFPWGQWPFAVDYPGFYTLHNSEEYPQNRQGLKLFLEWALSQNGYVKLGYRQLSQKIPTELTLFNNDEDIQSLGFFEPLFLGTGGKPQTFPRGTTHDWRLDTYLPISTPLAFEGAVSGVEASRSSADVNNIGLNGWLGHAGFVYSFWQKWELDLAYQRAQADGRLLASPSAFPNFQFHDSGEIFKVNYGLAPKTDAFFQFRNFNHNQAASSLNFHFIQLLTGFDLFF